MRQPSHVEADAALANGGWPLSGQGLSASLIAGGASDSGELAARGPRMWCVPIPEGGEALSTAPYSVPLASGATAGRTPLRARTPAARTAAASPPLGADADVAPPVERSEDE